VVGFVSVEHQSLGELYPCLSKCEYSMIYCWLVIWNWIRIWDWWFVFTSEWNIMTWECWYICIDERKPSFARCRSFLNVSAQFRGKLTVMCRMNSKNIMTWKCCACVTMRKMAILASWRSFLNVNAPFRGKLTAICRMNSNPTVSSWFIDDQGQWVDRKFSVYCTRFSGSPGGQSEKLWQEFFFPAPSLCGG
jgi:hypothetical protein